MLDRTAMHFHLKMTWEACTAAQCCARAGASSAVAMRLCPHMRPSAPTRAIMCHPRLKHLDKKDRVEIPARPGRAAKKGVTGRPHIAAMHLLSLSARKRPTPAARPSCHGPGCEQHHVEVERVPSKGPLEQQFRRILLGRPKWRGKGLLQGAPGSSKQAEATELRTDHVGH